MSMLLGLVVILLVGLAILYAFVVRIIWWREQLASLERFYALMPAKPQLWTPPYCIIGLEPGEMFEDALEIESEGDTLLAEGPSPQDSRRRS